MCVCVLAVADETTTSDLISYQEAYEWRFGYGDTGHLKIRGQSPELHAER